MQGWITLNFWWFWPTSQVLGLTPSISRMLSKSSSKEATSFAPGIFKPKQQPKQRNSADKSLLNHGNIKVIGPVFHTQSENVPHPRWLKCLSVLVVRTSCITSLTEAGRKGRVHVPPAPFVDGWQIVSRWLMIEPQACWAWQEASSSSELSWFNDKYIKQFAMKTIHTQSILCKPHWMLSLENKYATLGGVQVKALPSLRHFLYCHQLNADALLFP